MKALPLLTALLLSGCSFDGPSGKLEFSSWKARQRAHPPEPAPLVAPQTTGVLPPLPPTQPVTQIIVSGKDSRWNDPSPVEYAPRERTRR